MAEDSKEQAIEYTKYERARMIGSRALQISMGAPLMIELSKEQMEKLRFNPIDMAKLEFEAGVIPLTIRRPLPGERKKKLLAEAALAKKEQAQ
jgi:DNA-directed RNA polymerase subunit K